MSVFSGEDYILRFADAAIVFAVVALLVAYLRRTMLFRFVLCLAVVSICFVVADTLGFTLLRAFAGAVLGGLPLLMVVIFLPDIRRWLSAGASLSPRHQPTRIDYVREVAAATVQLSRQRIGALIVIQRGNSLDYLLEVGTEIDAKVTAELIASIFFPYSPIHDGAVIIQHGKLTRAGCLLPLSQDPTLSKSLGMRHRAALGLSEQSDAVAIVVSEESGCISLAHGGSLTLKLDPQETEGELRKLLGGSARARS
jgi:uncharacterized protein (TIGR00159 family)